MPGDQISNNIRGGSESPYLFRYQRVDLGDPERSEKRLRSVLIDSQLYFSTPIQLNDPFDSKITFDYKASEDKKKIKLKELYRARYPDAPAYEVNKKVREVIKQKKHLHMDSFGDQNAYNEKFGICCFTKKNNNILMWSHYADSHKGICYIFNHKKNDMFWGSAHEIKYRNKYPFFKYYYFNTEEVIVDILLTKYIDWKYEEEWRLVAFPKQINQAKQPGLIPFDSTSLLGVILGAKISDKDKNLVFKVNEERKKPVQIYQARTILEKYQIAIEEVK